MVNDLNTIKVRNGVPLLQRTYSIIPTEDNPGNWNVYSSLLNKSEFLEGEIELPEDSGRYEVYDDTLKITFIAEYDEYYKCFSDIVLNNSTWTTEINGEIFKLQDVTRWRKIELELVG